MHTVELLESAIQAAKRLGYQVRQDWLAGQGGGACVIRGEKWVFLDLASDYTEQLDQVVSALRIEKSANANCDLAVPDELVARIAQRAA